MNIKEICDRLACIMNMKDITHVRDAVESLHYEIFDETRTFTPVREHKEEGYCDSCGFKNDCWNK